MSKWQPRYDTNEYFAAWHRKWRHTDKGRRWNRFNQDLYAARRAGDTELVNAFLAARKKLGRPDLVDVQAIKRQLGRYAQFPRHEEKIIAKIKQSRASGVPIRSLLTPEELKRYEKRLTSRTTPEKSRAASAHYRKTNPHYRGQKKFCNTMQRAKRTGNVELCAALRKAWMDRGEQWKVDVNAVKRSLGYVLVGKRMVKP